MKILLISFSVNGALGDGFKLIARNLARNNETMVLTNYKISADDVFTQNICNLHFDKKSPLNFINPKNYILARRFLKRIEYDVCLVYSPHPANIIIYHWLNTKVTCVWVHDHYHHSGIRLGNFIVQKLNLRLFFKKSAKIIVCCNFIKEDILNRKLMKDASKIEVCEFGMLENLCFPIMEYKEDIDVLFFGRIKYYKGLDTLVDAAQMLANKQFVIAGRGNLKKECNINILPQNCKHINEYIPDVELAKLIQRSKVVVLPYRDATGSQTIHTVFYYKKPIVATRVGCFPEYISDGVDGIIIDPENPKQLSDALTELLNNDRKRLQFGNNGNNIIHTLFSNDRITAKLTMILKSLIINH